MSRLNTLNQKARSWSCNSLLDHLKVPKMTIYGGATFCSQHKDCYNCPISYYHIKHNKPKLMEALRHVQV